MSTATEQTEIPHVTRETVLFARSIPTTMPSHPFALHQALAALLHTMHIDAHPHPAMRRALAQLTDRPSTTMTLENTDLQTLWDTLHALPIDPHEHATIDRQLHTLASKRTNRLRGADQTTRQRTHHRGEAHNPADPYEERPTWMDVYLDKQERTTENMRNSNGIDRIEAARHLTHPEPTPPTDHRPEPDRTQYVWVLGQRIRA